MGRLPAAAAVGRHGAGVGPPLGRRVLARFARWPPGAPPGDGWRLQWVPAVALAALVPLLPGPAVVLGWVALAPLVAGLRQGGAGCAAWVVAGWAYGLVYAGVQLAWLQPALVGQAGMGWLHFVNFYALIVAGLALAPAAVLGGARWLWLRWGVSPLAGFPVLLAAQDALLGVFPFGGVAWGSLAAPQAYTLAARAVVPVLGGAGLVLLLGLVNAGWGAWGAALWQRPARPRVLAGSCAWAALTVACAWPAPPASVPPQAPTVQALLVPGTLSLDELEAQRHTAAPLRAYLARTLAALDAAPDGPPRLVVWPESAVPGSVARGKTLVELSELGGLLGADFLLGSNGEAEGRETNAAYLVNGGVFDFWRYDKRRLVPFGEYVPAGFRWLFPRKVTAGEADYVAGVAPPVLLWRGRRLGLAICFESILPGHVRDAVRAGAQLLVTMSNDAWLTPTAGRQHLRLTALRGLEAGRDVLVVANRGWSGHLRGGQALTRLHWREPPMRVQAALREGMTPFVRWGWAPLGVLGVLVLLAGAWGGVRRGR